MSVLPPLQQLHLAHDVSPPNPTDVPQDLLERILETAVHADDPCREVAKLCATKPEWLRWCRSGWMYDAANRALGYYGKYESWDAMVAAYPPWADKSPKTYFVTVCNMRLDRNTLVKNLTWAMHPFFMARLLQQARSKDGISLAVVPNIGGNYEEVARICLLRDADEIQYVQPYSPQYVRLAKVAVQQKAMALRLVPHDTQSYDKLERTQRRLEERKKQYYGLTRAEYANIAVLAAQQDGKSVLKFITQFSHHAHDILGDSYQLVAAAAVQQNGMAMKYVKEATSWPIPFMRFMTRNAYIEIAKLAVQQNGEALQFVQLAEGDDHNEIARLAILNDAGAIEHVRQTHPSWETLKRLADEEGKRQAEAKSREFRENYLPSVIADLLKEAGVPNN